MFAEQWYDWAGDQLAAQMQAEVAIPRMPSPRMPKYADWKQSLERLDIDDETTLIGHGLGASFLTRWLSERDKQIVTPEQLVLVGPWHRHRQRSHGAEFLHYDIDRNLAKRVGRVSLMTSADSSVNLLLSADYLYRKLGKEVEHHPHDGFGNFVVGNAMEDQTFPELLRVVATASNGNGQELQ